jgi:hypothetical protein
MLTRERRDLLKLASETEGEKPTQKQ